MQNNLAAKALIRVWLILSAGLLAAQLTVSAGGAGYRCSPSDPLSEEPHMACKGDPNSGL